MEVILLERIGKLGQMGDVVRVKDGFARNFLLPRGKALRATADNKKRFEEMKSELQARNLEMKGEAGKLAGNLDGKSYVVLRQASESGQLFGSVSTRDIAALLKEHGADVSRSQIVLNAPIKTIGQYKVPLALHPEVEVAITVTVARSADEAERIARGEDVTVPRTEAEEEAAAAAAAAEAMFEPGAKAEHETAPRRSEGGCWRETGQGCQRQKRRRRKTLERRVGAALPDYSPAPSAGLASPAAGGFDLGSTARRSGAMISAGLPSLGLASPAARSVSRRQPLASAGFGAAFFCSSGFGWSPLAARLARVPPVRCPRARR